MSYEPVAGADELLNVREVSKIVKMATSSIYRYVARGEFPEPVKLSSRMTRWRRSEIQAWINESGE